MVTASATKNKPSSAPPFALIHSSTGNLIHVKQGMALASVRTPATPQKGCYCSVPTNLAKGQATGMWRAEGRRGSFRHVKISFRCRRCVVSWSRRGHVPVVTCLACQPCLPVLYPRTADVGTRSVYWTIIQRTHREERPAGWPSCLFLLQSR